MTDEQIIIKEITECGFYCAKEDVERLYIYEVIKNTDEEWLKETPEQTLLIDEWIYDYTDYDDRKVYNTSGNLVAVCNVSATYKVYKIEDTKYKIYGNCRQFLIEDKPTYKEQLKAKERECESWKALIDEAQIEQGKLQQQLEAYKMEAEEGKEINAELKAKNDELKEAFNEGCLHNLTLITEKRVLLQTLTEIKEIAEVLITITDEYDNCYHKSECDKCLLGINGDCQYIKVEQILQKISEVKDV